MSKKKLFIDADSIITPRPSGIGSMTVQLIHALSKQGDFTENHEIILFAPFNKVHFINQWQFKNVKVKRIFLPGRVIAALIKFRIMPPVDLFIGKGVYLFPNFRNMPLLFSKSITYIHDVSFKVYPQFVEAKNLSFLTKHVDEWIKRSDVIVTVSNHAKDEINHYYKDAASKTKVVYNGVNETFMPLTQIDSGEIMKKYTLNRKEYFIFLSNLEPRKNVEGLLAAYRSFIALPGNENVQLLMVGGMGWKNEAILAQIAKINQTGERIILPKQYVPDSELPVLLSSAAALLHPAYYEGFGISPLQAMACGIQVVVADNSSLPEVVGDTGVYVDATKVDSILDGMAVAYSKRFELNKAGVVRARRFSWDSSAKELADIIALLEK